MKRAALLAFGAALTACAGFGERYRAAEAAVASTPYCVTPTGARVYGPKPCCGYHEGGTR